MGDPGGAGRARSSRPCRRGAGQCWKCVVVTFSAVQRCSAAESIRASGLPGRSGAALGEGCTRERRTLLTRVLVFLMILRFSNARSVELACSHVRRPPCVHVGARQSYVTDWAKPQNLNDNRCSFCRVASLPRAARRRTRSVGGGPEAARAAASCRAHPSRGRRPGVHALCGPSSASRTNPQHRTADRRQTRWARRLPERLPVTGRRALAWRHVDLPYALSR